MDTSYDNAAFSQKFTVRFLGSMEVKKDRGICTGSQGGRGSDNILIYHYCVCVVFFFFLLPQMEEREFNFPLTYFSIPPMTMLRSVRNLPLFP